MSSPELVQHLLQPESYPHVAQHVELRETHISWVFLTGEFAYKLKKPLDLGFANFVALEDRLKYCHEEVRRNRLYSQGLYLDVVPICIHENSFIVEGAGQAIDYAVKMRQFDDSQLASKLVSTGRLSSDDLAVLAGYVADIHQKASRSTEGVWGTPEDILRSAVENVEVLRRLTAEKEPLQQLDEIGKWTQDELSRLKTALERRKQQGFVRECHGDFHLGNLVYWNGRWTLFDCIEFNPDFYWIDVISEVAFLIMDLDDHGCSELGWQFLNTYLEHTGDYEGLNVLRFYLVYRAMVRAKVTALRLQQNRVPEQERHQLDREWHSYLHMASQYLKQPAPSLTITHGLSGSGKTFGTQGMLSQCKAVRIRSDIERKRIKPRVDENGQLHGQPLVHEPNWEEGHEGSLSTTEAYSVSSRDAVYEYLAMLSEMLLDAGYSVIVDATFLKRHHRARFLKIAKVRQRPFIILKFGAEKNQLQQRIRARQQSARDASEANETVLEQQILELEPLEPQELRYVVESQPLAREGQEDSHS